MNASHSVIDLTPDELEQAAADNAVVIDVREPFEHAEVRIAGAQLHPLSALDPGAIRRAHPDQPIIFHCRSGKRSRDAAERFAADVGTPARHLAGGIEAWIAAGKPVVRPPSAPRIPVMRQVQITAGGLVVLGVVLGQLLWSGFLVISLFVGCGLMFAGLSGWCGMAKLLGAMPWNRPHQPATPAPTPRPASNR